ncbi:hypothetical protein [Corynebacterium urealyticum]|uniref:hypothetical protein n=1 Tax=Corynebacterium urealyticum TaxID=43771 RepID=UPI0011E89074|nr:hypothetical protein [Corynebacterium urealyticum]TYR15207.1 hypothetical protein FYJ89_01240 [Corynebacterium urealyticum]TYR19047.1 hypothetical protein FYJ88_10015 [Corynebacterium urealyticum]
MALAESLQMERYYEDGFVPSSYDAPHSSLHRSITWVAMGSILSSLAFFGMAIYGLAGAAGSDNATGFVIAGLIGALLLLFGGFAMVHIGRANYREYVKRSGRIH